MTDYTLDISKWRCGGHGKNRLGKGITAMMNCEGYMCCLGQFAAQKGVSNELLMGRAGPSSVAGNSGSTVGVYDENILIEHPNKRFIDTNLANRLIRINDIESFSLNERINLLKTTLELEGHTLTVINDEVLSNHELSTTV